MSDLRIGVIGGSGIGQLFAEEDAGVVNVIDTPFGPPSAPVTEVRWHDTTVLLLPRHGHGHLLSPSQVPYRANIYALKKLGVTHILATGAVGSLRQEFAPRDLVIADQIIDKTFSRPGTFFDSAAVHVEFAEPFCPMLRQLLIEAAESGPGSRVPGSGKDENQGTVTSASSPEPGPRNPEPVLRAHPTGCYVAMEGPAFSTRAEAHMHRLWGGDLIGMTAMPEAKLAREAEIPYALVALVTDYDSWKAQPMPTDGEPPKRSDAALLDEIIGNLTAASASAVALIRRAIEIAAADPARLAESPAKTALARAIWSDKSQIPRSEVERLAPLWLHYFVRPTE